MKRHEWCKINFYLVLTTLAYGMRAAETSRHYKLFIFLFLSEPRMYTGEFDINCLDKKLLLNIKWKTNN